MEEFLTPRRLILAGIAAGGLVVLLIGFFVLRFAWRSVQLAPFRQRMAQYMTLDNSPVGVEDLVKGKVLPLDIKAKDVDSIYFDLPSEIAAQTPEEVGVLVRISYAVQPVAHYKGGAAINQDFCLITVTDASGHGLGGVVRLEGPMPGRVAKPGSDRTSLHDKVLAYLKSLKPGARVGDLHP